LKFTVTGEIVVWTVVCNLNICMTFCVIEPAIPEYQFLFAGVEWRRSLLERGRRDGLPSGTHMKHFSHHALLAHRAVNLMLVVLILPNCFLVLFRLSPLQLGGGAGTD
jgi:hypothetical protein